MPIIRTPDNQPYSRAREILLRHFGRTPRQLARELHHIRGMGDRLPSEHLDHLYGLLPDVKALFEVLLLDYLPDNARVAALQHSDVRAMAKAADAVVLENRAAAAADRHVPSVNSVALLDGDLSDGLPPPLDPVVAALSSASRGPRPPLKKTETLCAVHARWGKEAYTCRSPSTCKMHNILRPPPQKPASGNGKAGGQ